MLNNVVGYRAYIRGIFVRGACIWKEVTVSMCCGLIHGGGAYIRGDLYSEVYGTPLALSCGKFRLKTASRNNYFSQIRSTRSRIDVKSRTYKHVHF